MELHKVCEVNYTLFTLPWLWAVSGVMQILNEVSRSYEQVSELMPEREKISMSIIMTLFFL